MKSRFRIVATLGVTQTLAWASTFYLPAILAEPIGRDIGLSPSWIYAGLSLGLSVSAFLGPAIGREIDQRGGRRMLCSSNVVFALGLAILGVSRGPITLLVAWLVLGVAMAAGFYEVAFASLTRLYGRDSRSAITGITLIAGFASTVGWPISTFLEHAVGWRGCCLAWAALHVFIGLPLNAWSLSREANAAVVEPSTPVIKSAEHEETANRTMRILAFMFAATGMVGIGMATNLPRLFSAIGVSPTVAIAAASLMGPAQVIARILEYGARRWIDPLISAKVASALHPVAAIAIATGGAPAMSLFAVIHGAGNGMLTIVRGTLPLALFGPSGYGARIGQIAVPSQIGRALAPFLMGLSIDRLGAATLFISAGLSLMALASLFWLSLPAPALLSRPE